MVPRVEHSGVALPAAETFPFSFPSFNCMRAPHLPALLALAAIVACGGADTTVPAAKVVSRVTITGANTTLDVGQTATLSAAAFEASGVQITSPGTTIWSSSATGVTTVDQVGKLTAIGAGSATITADIARVKGTINVTVNLAGGASKDTIFTLPTQWLPAFVIISVGQSVVFRFGGSITHNAIFSKFNVPGAPIDIGNAANQTFVRTFNARGRFPFECTLHNGMVGEITVN